MAIRLSNDLAFKDTDWFIWQLLISILAQPLHQAINQRRRCISYISSNNIQLLEAQIDCRQLEISVHKPKIYLYMKVQNICPVVRSHD